MLSIVTPAFNEAANLQALYDRVTGTMAALGEDWEWIVVDDHSADGTFTRIRDLAARDARVRGLRLARNSGSHMAITAGLHHARGAAAVVMAADLQDPPEVVGSMLARWRQGAQVVWATRRVRPGERAHAGFAVVYYWIMRRVVGLTEIPARGADFFLLDRAVLDAFGRHAERQVSVFALISSMGFRQEFVEYDKQPRAAGRSGWTLAKKAALVADSVTAFSAFPLRAVAGLGAALMAGGLAVGLWAWTGAHGGAVLALASAMAVFTGLQLAAVGLVGEYVWRGLELSRRRPVYLVEAATGGSPALEGESVTPKIE